MAAVFDPPTKDCAECGETFTPYVQHGPKKWAERRFCTAACAGRFGGRGLRKPASERKPTYRNGYKLLWCGRRERFVYEHRLVMEAEIGRDLLSTELVHHLNHDKLDNRLENLAVMPRGEHQRMHTMGNTHRRDSLR